MTIARLNECYREGQDARERGLDIHQNPYKFDLPENGSWQEGWLLMNEHLASKAQAGNQ